MSSRSGRPSSFHRFSRDHEGFQRLAPDQAGDATVDIPMQNVDNGSNATFTRDAGAPTASEKAGAYHQEGLRRAPRDAPQRQRRVGTDGEEDAVTKLGLFYRKVLGLSIVMRWITLAVPVGLIIAIPVVIGATAAQNATIGQVRMVWIFTWLECCWLGLWASKIVAHFLPRVFTSVVGVVSAGTRKYASVIRALHVPLSLCGWALVSLATFMPLMNSNPDTMEAQNRAAKNGEQWTSPYWESVVQRILAAAMIATLIFLGERTFIQLISINYHRKQFTGRIKQSKRNVWLLGLLYEASRAMFPTFCHEFVEEDAIIADFIDLSGSKKKTAHARSGSSTPMRILRDVGRMRNKISSAFGNVAQEVTGKTVFHPESAHSVIVEALEKTRSSEALAKRLWLSFVIEGHDALYQEDINEVLGAGHEAEAEECFIILDKDGNGDVSLDEMILTVNEIGRERFMISNSMHDVDQAINVLDRMLCVIILIIVIFIFVAFLNQSFVTTLATTGTALISLSFIFSVSAQEILGSCIFLFVKHPYDIGDRVDLNTGTDQLIVEHISLLFTVFRRVTNHRTVQIPNILLNTLWIENVSRSKAMREQITVYCAFETSIEDIQLLRSEIVKFVSEKENSRDFYPEVEVEVVDVASMDKMQLLIEVRHKSNWSNETVRSARRSKFMCALVLALKRIPIYGPLGSDPELGAYGNPRYTVPLSDIEASKMRDENASGKESKRLVPSKPAKAGENLEVASESNALGVLNERSPMLDGARDIGTSRTEGLGLVREGSQTQALEEVRGILRRETTKGKRKSPRGGQVAPLNTTDVPGTSSQVPNIGLTAPSPIGYPARSPGSQYAADRGSSFLDEWQRGTESEIEDEDEFSENGPLRPPFPPPRLRGTSSAQRY